MNRLTTQLNQSVIQPGMFSLTTMQLFAYKHIQGNITLTSNIQREHSDTNRQKNLHALYQYIKCGSIYLHV